MGGESGIRGETSVRRGPSLKVVLYKESKGLVTNYGEGELQNGRGGIKGGHVKFCPYEKGGRQGFSHAEGGGGGHNKFWGSFYVVAQSFSHIEGRVQKDPTLKGGGVKSFKLSGGGGGAKRFRPAIFPFCSPPLPVINDQSLSLQIQV